MSRWPTDHERPPRLSEMAHRLGHGCHDPREDCDFSDPPNRTGVCRRHDGSDQRDRPLLDNIPVWIWLLALACAALGWWLLWPGGRP